METRQLASISSRMMVGVAILALTATSVPANAENADKSDNPREAARQVLIESGIPADKIPSDTLLWLAEKFDSDLIVSDVVSAQYGSGATSPADGGISPLGYSVAPCYLTVVTQYNFASPRWVDNDSLTGCTTGFSTSTRHDMDLDKLDTVFGTVSLVAQGERRSNYAGSFSSTIRYGCPTTNRSGFRGDTAGEIFWRNAYYYATADSGSWDYYNCG